MLKRLFRKAADAPNPEPGPQMSMVALRSDKGLNPAEVCRAWSELFPSEPALIARGQQESVFEYQVSDQSLMVAHMEIPIPPGDLDFACARSWMWPEAAAGLAGHTTHAVIVPMLSGNPVDEAMLGSRIACALIRSGDVAGVYWGNGGQVHKPDLFLAMVTELDGDGLLPLPAWVGLAVSGRSPSGPFTLTTMGLAPFGHKEFEILNAKTDIGGLRGMVYDVIGYVLENGPVLRHGDTFGPDPQTRWRIEHTVSKFRRGEPVIRLHL